MKSSLRRAPQKQTVAPAFITFEGIDGSGKSTQLRLLASDLRAQQRHLEIVVTREPGGTPLGARLRSALLDVETIVDPLAELLLYAADRAQHVRTLIRPALDSGRIVLSDRYADATVAYQGAGRGFPRELIEQIIAIATAGLRPDLTLVFDVSPEAGLARRSRRMSGGSASDRLDAESTEFHARVRAAYLEIAAREPVRVKVIDAGASIQVVHGRVKQIVSKFFKSRVPPKQPQDIQ
ncbi:MAG: dTMP kinase [Pyrinomonadaceae bacterium]